MEMESMNYVRFIREVSVSVSVCCITQKLGIYYFKSNNNVFSSWFCGSSSWDVLSLEVFLLLALFSQASVVSCLVIWGSTGLYWAYLGWLVFAPQPSLSIVSWWTQRNKAQPKSQRLATLAKGSCKFNPDSLSGEINSTVDRRGAESHWRRCGLRRVKDLAIFTIYHTGWEG